MTRSRASLLLALLASCGSIRARSQHAPEVDFAAYRTFAIVPAETETPGLPRFGELRERRLERAIAARLERKGLTEVAPEEADLHVSFTMATQHKTGAWGGEDEDEPVWEGDLSYEDVSGEELEHTTYFVSGTIVIDFVDRSAERLVWHGWATADITDPRKTERREVDAVSAILAKYPPEGQR